MSLPRIHSAARAWLGCAAALAFGSHAEAASPATATFEGGAPAGFYVFNGGASSVTTAATVVAPGDPLTRPGQAGPNTALTVQFTIGD
ncbi:MAG TPA: hypothetical protein VIG50_00530, partial [Vicinamibacteria bacterium]